MPEPASALMTADDHARKWLVVDNENGRTLHADRTCRGARSWAEQVAGAPLCRVRAGLYGVRGNGWALTIAARGDRHFDGWADASKEAAR